MVIVHILYMCLQLEFHSYCLYCISSHSFHRKGDTHRNFQSYSLKSALSKVKNPPSPTPETLVKEPHKYFDQVVITVRAGDGGHGAILSMPTQRAASNSRGKFGKNKIKEKSSYKRDFDGSLVLPMGGHGGDVVIYADESKDSLLEFHKKSRYSAKRGGNADSMGVLSSQLRDGLAAPSLRIPVPPGLWSTLLNSFIFILFCSLSQ